MLTLQYIPYNELVLLNPAKRISKLVDIAKENKIILMEGRLSAEEEAKLIERTMEEISSEFKGVEICTIDQDLANKPLMYKFKSKVAKILLGKKDGLTIIGPAMIVKEIKRDPNKIELFTLDSKKNGKRKK
jgi:hypothetical protein